MRLVARLFGKKREQAKERPLSELQIATREQTRRELISMAVRDTLRRHGLPAGCITAEGVPSVTPARYRGMHIQLVFREWRPGLLSYIVAIEGAVKARLARLDPMSASWVTGLAWRFEPGDAALWPELPAPRKPGNDAPSLGETSAEAARDALRKLFATAAAAPHRAPAGRADFSPTLPMAPRG